MTLLLAALMMLAWLVTGPGARAAAGTVPEVALDGPVGPASADFVVAALADAEQANAPAVILRIDTPGGLSSSMRDIDKAILASPVPVIGYVAPGGARAASAGTYILYATHIAAMAPTTHLGAATPINIGDGGGGGGGGSNDNNDNDNDKPNGSSASDKNQNATNSENGETPVDLDNDATERRKQVNDAAAYIRSLAERRGRNADWAEKAVRQAATLSATEAEKIGVIDLIAPDEKSLLAAVDGRRIQTAAGVQTLATKNAAIETITPDWRTRLLATVTNPTVAYLLFMIGLVGLAAEAFNPGATVPGVIGGISLITALYAFHLLPVDFSGLALIVLGVALVVAEAFVPSFGILGLGGTAALAFGSIMLMDTPGYDISLAVVTIVVVATVALLALLVWMYTRSRRMRIRTGHEGLIGERCHARYAFDDVGRVWLHGESWRATVETPVAENDTLIVTAVDGLTVRVRPATRAESGPADTRATTTPQRFV